jgi:hypothetical protein
MAAPTDQPDLDLTPDRAAINDAFNELNTKGQVLEHTFIDNSTREQLLNTVNGSDIFHFIGHGEFQEADVDEAGNWLKKGQIVLEKEDGKSDRYPSDLLANTLDNAGVRLVVLGACNSASRDQGGAWTGVAPALVREDIPAVLAMQYKVQQKSAQAFMRSFYALALAGYSIDEAMFLGRQAILNEHGIENRDWGVPVIYLRAEDGVIFPFSSVVTPEIVSKMYAEQYFDNVNRSTVIGNLDESDGSSEMESHQKANTITDTVLTGNKRTGKPSSGESKSTTDLGSVSRSKVIGEEHQVL